MTAIAQPVPELPVADLERARSYYCEKLGFSRGWAFPDIASVYRGEVVVFFRVSKEPIAAQVHWIYAPDVEASYIEMKNAGVLVTEHLENKPWGLRQFTISDPDGHLFYIHQDIDNDAEPGGAGNA